jgi:hypothetical protein
MPTYDVTITFTVNAKDSNHAATLVSASSQWMKGAQVEEIHVEQVKEVKS